VRPIEWGAVVKHAIGLRHAYDYLFVNPAGLPRGMYATASRDIHRLASDTPAVTNTKYVFNGTRFYSTGLWSDATWRYTTTNPPLAAPKDTTVAPVLRLTESLIDSKGRVFSSYLVTDPTNDARNGLYVHVANSTGATLLRAKWPGVPTFGYVRIFEDARQRLWVLWTGQGTRATHVRLYPVTESGTALAPMFSLGSYTDLSKAFVPFAIQGALYIATPRGGNDRSNKIEAIFNACYSGYAASRDFESKYCYMEADGTPRGQRVFYVRIALPQ
jgi:hypothetical protein